MAVALLLDGVLLLALVGYLLTVEDGWALVISFVFFACTGAAAELRDGRPLSWTTALPERQPVVHVTTGMARLLPGRRAGAPRAAAPVLRGSDPGSENARRP